MSKNLNKNKLLNENYSLMGKISIQKYPILFQKDEIMKGIQKKYKIRDIFTPDEPKKNDKLEEYYSLFNKYQLSSKDSRNSKKKKKSKLEFSYKLMKNNPRLIYHNKHFYSEEKNKGKSGSYSCTYVPKYDFIKPRLLTGPIWKNSKGRKEKKEEIDLRNYYINKLDFMNNPDIKCLVNMNKTTQRGEFINEKNIRLRNETTFIKPNNYIDEDKFKNISLFVNLSNVNQKYFKNKYQNYFTDNVNKNKKNRKVKSRLTRNKNDNNNNNSYKTIDIFSKTYNKFNFNGSNNLYEEEKERINNNESANRKQNKTINNFKNNNNRNFTLNIKTDYTRIGTTNSYSIRGKNKEKNRAPDFKKIISRDQIEKGKGERKFKIPFIVPNYSLVRERPLVMTIYRKEKRKEKDYNPKSKIIEGIDYKIKYEPDKIINKCNNHLEINAPNFDNMLSREYSEKNPLPLYMKNIYDRGAICRVTEKTLKLNKYKEGKMISASSSFLPKKSFNKIININLIKSHNFKEKINDEFIEEQKEILKTEVKRKTNEDEINNLKDLGVLTQFENFTYKTIEKRNNISSDNTNTSNGIYKSLKQILAIC